MAVHAVWSEPVSDRFSLFAGKEQGISSIWPQIGRIEAS